MFHHAVRVDELAEQYGRMVYDTAYRILGNPADAEDVLQDVFLKLVNLSHSFFSYKPIQNWGAYLKVIASRQALDALRKKKKWVQDPSSDDSYWQNLPSASEENPDCRLDRQQQAQLLRRALQTLPERDAQVFVLRYFEEMPYEEIAKQMHLSLSQVGVILHRSREHLRVLLEPLIHQTGSNPSSSRKENIHV